MYKGTIFNQGLKSFFLDVKIPDTKKLHFTLDGQFSFVIASILDLYKIAQK